MPAAVIIPHTTGTEPIEEFLKEAIISIITIRAGKLTDTKTIVIETIIIEAIIEARASSTTTAIVISKKKI